MYGGLDDRLTGAGVRRGAEPASRRSPDVGRWGAICVRHGAGSAAPSAARAPRAPLRLESQEDPFAGEISKLSRKTILNFAFGDTVLTCIRGFRGAVECLPVLRSFRSGTEVLRQPPQH